MNLKKVLIVQPHPLFADALASCIEQLRPGIAVEHACDLAVAESLAEENDFEFVVLDLPSIPSSGLSALIRLRIRFPTVPIIVVSDSIDRSLIDTVRVLGASGIIAKSARRDVILRVLAGALAGELAIAFEEEDMWRAGYMRGQPFTSKHRVEALSKNQLRVLQFMCQGLFNRQIAHALHVQETTVKAHIREILRKLHAISRTQAVIKASMSGVVDHSHFHLRRPIALACVNNANRDRAAA